MKENSTKTAKMEMGNRPTRMERCMKAVSKEA